MEIKIGIQNVAREVTLEVDLSVDQILQAYRQARSSDDLLDLTDAAGHQTMIPATGIAYIEFGKEHVRPVGFGTDK